MTKQTLTIEVTPELREQILALVKEKEKEIKSDRAEKGSMYFFIDSIGVRHYSPEQGKEADTYRYSIGNYSIEGGQSIHKRDEWLKAVTKIQRTVKRLNDGWVVDWSDVRQQKWYSSYDEAGKKIMSKYACFSHDQPNWLYTKDEATARQLVAECNKELMIYWGVKK